MLTINVNLGHKCSFYKFGNVISSKTWDVPISKRRNLIYMFCYVDVSYLVGDTYRSVPILSNIFLNW